MSISGIWAMLSLLNRDKFFLANWFYLKPNEFFGERIAEGQRKSDDLIRIITKAIKDSNGEKKN